MIARHTAARPSAVDPLLAQQPRTSANDRSESLRGVIHDRPRGEVRLDSWGHIDTLTPSMRRKLASVAPSLTRGVGLMAMAIALAACTKIESRDLIREGNQLYRDGRWEEAIEKYNQSLEMEPDGVTVLWNRAMAAESIVLNLKDATEEKDVALRKQYATIAIESLDEWNEKREKSGNQDDSPECSRPQPAAPPPAATPAAPGAPDAAATAAAEEDNIDPDLKAYKEHRLAVLGADARCDDLVEHWRQMHMACPQNEDLYNTIAQTFEDICGMPDKAEEWYVKRTEDFPESSKAWYAIATRHFYPLMPDPESGLPFNAAIDAKSRIAISDEVIAYLEKATALDPKYRDPYVWRSMAYTQKSLAREYVEPPDSPVDAIEALLKRRDLMLAWRETKAVCDIERIPDCPLTVEPGVLFADLDNPATDSVTGVSTGLAKWKDLEVQLFGNVVNDSVKAVDKDKLVYEFDLEVPYTPVVPVPVEGEAPPPPPVPVEGEGEGENPEAKPTKLVKVNYTFMTPVVEAGEPTPDISAEIQAQLDVWKKLKTTDFSGRIGRGPAGEYTLTVQQKQLMACCPPAPLTPDEEKSDATRLEELRAELAALEAAEAAEAAAAEGKGKGKKKGKKGR
jgi:tetratricopeptide (TPR) repeat protein